MRKPRRLARSCVTDIPHHGAKQFRRGTFCAACCYVDRAQTDMIDDKQITAKIDKLVLSMRGVIDELSPDERTRVLTSIRAISNDVADRLEAPSGRNH